MSTCAEDWDTRVKGESKGLSTVIFMLSHSIQDNSVSTTEHPVCAQQRLWGYHRCR